MQVSVVHDYLEDLDTILRFFSEEELITEKYQSLGAKSVRINRLEETDDGFLVETQRDMPANVPVMLKSILGSDNTIKQSEKWYWQEDGNILCEMKVDIVGVPASINGQMVFSEPTSGPATQNNVAVTISSSLPFVGSALVSFIGDDIKHQMQAEYDFLREALPQLLAE